MLDIRAARLNRPQHGHNVSRTGWARLYAIAEGMRYSGQVAPSADAENVGKYQTVEQVIRVAPGSHLVSLATVSDQSAGFRFNVFDSAGRGLFPTLVHSSTIGSPVSASSLTKRGQHFLLTPWVVPPPGALTVRIANLAAVSNRLQVYLVFAEPVTAGRKG